MLKAIKDLYYYSPLSAFVQWLTVICFLYPFYQMIYKTTVEYTGKQPDRSQNYVVVSNHRSMKDPPLVGFSLCMPFAFIAKKELFSNPILYLYMVLTSTISVDRDSTDSSTFKAAKKALKTKNYGLAWGACMFIEGTRSEDPERLGQPHKGPIFLARLSKCPVLPIGISYREGNKIHVKVGEAYEIDYKGDLDEQAWDCLEKISKLCDYSMPSKVGSGKGEAGSGIS